MGTTVYLRDGMGGAGSTFTVASGQTVRLGRILEFTADETVREGQADSAVVAGVATATQARSLFQSDGATARADNTVYAGEKVAVSQYGIFRTPTDGSSTLTYGQPVKVGTAGVPVLWVTGVDAADLKVGRLLKEPYDVTVGGTSTEFVDIALYL